MSNFEDNLQNDFDDYKEFYTYVACLFSTHIENIITQLVEVKYSNAKFIFDELKKDFKRLNKFPYKVTSPYLEKQEAHPDDKALFYKGYWYEVYKHGIFKGNKQAKEKAEKIKKTKGNLPKKISLKPRSSLGKIYKQADKDFRKNNQLFHSFKTNKANIDQNKLVKHREKIIANADIKYCMKSLNSHIGYISQKANTVLRVFSTSLRKDESRYYRTERFKEFKNLMSIVMTEINNLDDYFQRYSSNLIDIENIYENALSLKNSYPKNYGVKSYKGDPFLAGASAGFGSNRVLLTH